MFESIDYIENGEPISNDVLNRPLSQLIQSVDISKDYFRHTLVADFRSFDYYTYESPWGWHHKQYTDLFTHERNTVVVSYIPNYGQHTHDEDVAVFDYDTETDERYGLRLDGDEIKIDGLQEKEWFNAHSGIFYIRFKDIVADGVLLFDGVPILEDVSGDGWLAISYTSKNTGSLYVDGVKVYDFFPVHGLDFSEVDELLLVAGGEGVIEEFWYDAWSPNETELEEL